MKRPPGLWVLLTIAAVWLCIEDVDSLRATALILGKSPTTTTTTTETPQEADHAVSAEVVTQSNGAEESQNSTKPVLTGIPQIDYIWDPNLPRELNGYNLSAYPFYDRVPEEINFKCDGLHDGFYASVPHKCQVYHHCLFGVRYDFLCANYTAFDQKTFICHFVSEVDCVNSKKFWHRNDALYQAATTTTVKPTTVYTPPPTPATPIPITPILNRRPGGAGRRPGRPLRRRPQYDYYEDEYEETDYEDRRVRKRPRYRPRPVYSEDYEDYEDETYSKRRPNRRRPYDRRGDNRRNKDERRKYDEREYADEEDEEPRGRPVGDRRNTETRMRPNKRRPAEDEDYDRRMYERPKKRTRRPTDEEDYEEDSSSRRPGVQKNNKSKDEDRRSNDDDEDGIQKNQDDRPRKNNRNEERNKNTEKNREDQVSRNDQQIKNKNEEKKNKNDAIDEEPPLTKAPISVYERRRPPPKIRPPVPLNEQGKYVPKTTAKTTTQNPVDDEEYYDDYEEEPVRETKRKPEEAPRRKPPLPKRTFGNKGRNEDDYEEEDVPLRRTTKRPESKDRRVGSGSRRKPIIEEYEDYEDEKPIKSSHKDGLKPTTIQRQEPTVKVVKRPFLPSRGGNPYTSRGLLPIGLKAIEETTEMSETQRSQESKQKLDAQNESNKSDDEVRSFKPSPAIVKLRNKYNQGYEDYFRPVTNRPVSRINVVKLTTTTTTQKPKVIEKNPLDLDENEYDVTLNDALNPTLPNLPIRSFPTGFTTSNDYNYNTVQRSRYVADPTLNQASSDYVYSIQPVQSRYVPVYQNYRQTPRQQTYYAGY